MADDQTNKPGKDQEADDEDALLNRFPSVPTINPDVPAAPKIKVDLPPHPYQPKPGAAEPGSYRNMALASTAASSFIMPIIVLILLGWVLDKQFHTGGIAIVVCLILGFVVGVANLMRIMNRMNDDPPKRK